MLAHIDKEGHMAASTEVRFVFAIEVTDLDGFKSCIEECCAISATEPGTLIYDWYLDEDGRSARLYEAYASVDAVIAHASGPVFTEVGPRLLQTCRFISGDCFGDPGRLATGPQLLPVTYLGEAVAGLDPR